MVIHVTVVPARKGYTYLAGEDMDFDIVLEAQGEDKDDTEVIAWLSCQIHCSQSLNSSRVKTSTLIEAKSMDRLDAAKTSLQAGSSDRGSVWLYSSKPSILCADISLTHGEVRRFRYVESIPSEGIPPSWNGKAVQYCYKMTVALQRPGVSFKLLNVPLRILRLDGLSAVSGIDEKEFSPVNPFLPTPTPKEYLLEVANELTETYVAGRSYHVYNITTDSGSIGKFTLIKNCYKLGDDVIGFFTFDRQASTRCVQYLAELQTEEEVVEDYRLKSDQKAPVSTHAKDYRFCLHLEQCQVTLQIPLSGSQSFFSNYVHVRWRLHFEFVLTGDPDGFSYAFMDDSVGWNAAKTLKVETLTWDLPVKVYPCRPETAAAFAAGNSETFTMIA